MRCAAASFNKWPHKHLSNLPKRRHACHRREGQVTTGAGSRLVALVNPAWKSVSDFGLFGAGEAEKALSDFELTYSLQSLVVYGYTVRPGSSFPCFFPVCTTKCSLL